MSCKLVEPFKQRSTLILLPYKQVMEGWTLFLLEWH